MVAFDSLIARWRCFWAWLHPSPQAHQSAENPATAHLLVNARPLSGTWRWRWTAARWVWYQDAPAPLGLRGALYRLALRVRPPTQNECAEALRALPAETLIAALGDAFAEALVGEFARKRYGARVVGGVGQPVGMFAEISSTIENDRRSRRHKA